ncbi:hypothetical protein ACVXG9_13380 [Escherichia coli]
MYVGGGWQGKDSNIRNADKVVMQGGAALTFLQRSRVTAVRLCYHQRYTNFHGQISAKGGGPAVTVVG